MTLRLVISIWILSLGALSCSTAQTHQPDQTRPEVSVIFVAVDNGLVQKRIEDLKDLFKFDLSFRPVELDSRLKVIGSQLVELSSSKLRNPIIIVPTPIDTYQ